MRIVGFITTAKNTPAKFFCYLSGNFPVTIIIGQLPRLHKSNERADFGVKPFMFCARKIKSLRQRCKRFHFCGCGDAGIFGIERADFPGDDRLCDLLSIGLYLPWSGNPDAPIC